MNRDRRREILVEALRRLAESGKTTTSYTYLSWRFGVPETEVRILYQQAREHAPGQHR